jgi:gas vesicle protein
MQSHSSSGHEQGSFLTGFTLGLFAGAAGYFMFGTNKGRKLRERLADEWENARMEVGDKGLPNMSFRDMLGSLLKTFQTPETEKTPAKKAAKPAAKDSKSKFKGL